MANKMICKRCWGIEEQFEAHTGKDKKGFNWVCDIYRPDGRILWLCEDSEPPEYCPYILEHTVLNEHC